jgi:hypothetical protein
MKSCQAQTQAKEKHVTGARLQSEASSRRAPGCHQQRPQTRDYLVVLFLRQIFGSISASLAVARVIPSAVPTQQAKNLNEALNHNSQRVETNTRLADCSAPVLQGCAGNGAPQRMHANHGVSSQTLDSDDAIRIPNDSGSRVDSDAVIGGREERQDSLQSGIDTFRARNLIAARVQGSDTIVTRSNRSPCRLGGH